MSQWEVAADSCQTK